MAFLLAGAAGILGLGYLFHEALPDAPPAILTKPRELIDDAKQALDKHVIHRPPSTDSYYATKEAMKLKYGVK